MFSVGQWAYDSIQGYRVQIVGKEELWDYVSYRVYDPVSRMVYPISETYLKYETEEDHSIAYVRYIAALAKIRQALSGAVAAGLGENVLPLPHQLYALRRALADSNIRYLLADEVGLGKTIEAGLIIKELKARGLIKKTLVVCPKGLVTQWHMEMAEKFGEKFVVVLPEDYETLRRIHGAGNVYEPFDQVISPMDSIKPLDRRAGWDEDRIREYNEERIHSIANCGWDLIIIDEAHRVAGSSSDVARYKMARLLAKASPYLLLLTATPHSGKTEPFLRLVRLLDERAFPDQQAIVREQVAPYVIRTEKREAIDHDGNRLFRNRITRLIEVEWTERHSLQRELYHLVTKYVARGYNKALKEKRYHIGFLMVLMQRLVSSSTAAIRDSIERRMAVLTDQQAKISELSWEELVEVDVESALQEVLMTATSDIKGELRELEDILAVAKQAEYQFLDAKAEHLIELLDELYGKERQRKVIIFTEFIATQAFLKNLLERRGYTCSVLNGSMSIEERNTTLHEFRTKTDLLISTDAGGEGLNLQFSNVVINYDLPWNPMKIEQRIGRVDRIGQSQDVLVFNYVLQETVEKRVREVLEGKLSVILAQMGIDKLQDVLDNELAEFDFTDVYINSIADPRCADYYVDRLEADVKEQVEQAQKVRELIRDEKSLHRDSALDVNTDGIKALLRQMYSSYREWKHGVHQSDSSETAISLNNEEIKGLIQQDLHWDRAGGAVMIWLPDLPNEKGYWSLWELGLSTEPQDKRIITVFVNTNGIKRPASAMRIWEELLKPNRQMEILGTTQIGDDDYQRLQAVAKEMAYEEFLRLKGAYEERNKLAYRRYLYALELRLEAAGRIGIENIRNRRIELIKREREELEKQYMYKTALCPVFKPLLISFVE